MVCALRLGIQSHRFNLQLIRAAVHQLFIEAELLKIRIHRIEATLFQRGAVIVGQALVIDRRGRERIALRRKPAVVGHQIR